MSKEIEDLELDNDELETDDAATPAEPAEKPDRGDVITVESTEEADDSDDIDDDDFGHDETADTQAAATTEGNTEPAEKGGKGIMIPKGRFDEALREKQALKEEADALRAQLQQFQQGQPTLATAAPITPTTPDPIDTFDEEAKEIERMEAWEEGDTEKWKALNKEIKEHNEAKLTRKAQALALEMVQNERATAAAKAEQNSVKDVEAALLEAYPTLNEDGKDYFAFVGLRDMYRSKGMSLADAMTLAAADTFPEPAEGDTITNEQDEPSGLTQRQLAAKLKNAKAMNAQPPVTRPGMGVKEFNKAKIDVSKLSEEEFDKLSAEDKKKARGDFVAGKR